MPRGLGATDAGDRGWRGGVAGAGEVRREVDLDQFLRAGGTDLRALVSAVDTALVMQRDDALLAVGSLVEGLGTSRSDLDLLLVTSNPERQLAADEERAIIVGRCLVDVRIVSSARLSHLLARFHNWSREPWNLIHAATFTDEERVLLHRLLHARYLEHGSGGLSNEIPRPSPDAVARLKLHVARQISRTVQVDMAGHADVCDAASLAFAAQDLLGHAVDALTAGHGLTNPRPKWRARLLDSLPDDWDRELGTRPSQATAADLVWRLHRAPERPDYGPALDHARRITAFARAAFLWAERRLVRSDPTTSAADRLVMAERRPTDAPLPHLALDVDLVMVGDGAVLGKLNSFGSTALHLSPAELSLALLFDGITTRDEARAFASAPSEPPLRLTVVEDLVARVRAAGLAAA